MVGLIADIGGTNVRFALCAPDGRTHDPITLTCADFDGLAAAVRAYLERARPATPPRRAAMAAACPVDGDVVDLTNSAWRFSIAETRDALGLDSLRVINDFAANALAAPYLGSDDKVRIGGGAPRPGWPVAAIGPGTGLGVGTAIPVGDDWIALSGEGGHVTLAAADDRESDLIDGLRRRLGHVSAERLLSGGGLELLYRTIRERDGRPPDPLDAAAIGAAAARPGPAAEALETLFAMLGTVAGNLALTTGARGGVCVMGGIVPRHLDRFTGSAFRARFEAKGRFSAYLADIPTWVVTHPHPAFVGLSRLVATST